MSSGASPSAVGIHPTWRAVSHRRPRGRGATRGSGWNAKALVKPVLGPSYARVADWLLAKTASTTHG